ncbi:hypothetical protein ANCDUO_07677, partial [Ancylostoma duodenale]
LLNEVHLLASLQHENIVRYHTGWLELYREENPTSSNTSPSSKTVVITEVNDDDADAFESSEQSATVPPTSEKGADTATPTNVQPSSSDKSSSTTGPGRFWVRAKQVHASSPNFSEETVESDHVASDLSVQPTQQSVQLFNIMDTNLQNVYRPEILIQMELCTSNLERHLKKRNNKIREMGLGELSVDGAFNRELAIQMLSAIEFLHQKNVIHRDIKPSNIFLKHHGEKIRFLLGDFGLACEHNETANQTNISKPGTSDAVSFVVKHTSGTGTKTYAAQEQLKSSTYGPAVDIFAAGMVLFEAYQIFYTGMEKVQAFDIVRNRKNKRQFIDSFPAFARNWPSVDTEVQSVSYLLTGVACGFIALQLGKCRRDLNEGCFDYPGPRDSVD